MLTWTGTSWAETSWNLDSWESRIGKKFFSISTAGYIYENTAVKISDGASREGNLVSLGSNGVLNLTILNAKSTSEGLDDSGKLPVLDTSGKLSTTFMPTGIVADACRLLAAENLGSGSIVNIFNDGVSKCRKASASFSNREAHGYVLSACQQDENVLVYFEGNNNQVTGMVPGALFLSATAGLATSTPPTGSGQIVQRIGFATESSSMNFQVQTPIVLE